MGKDTLLSPPVRQSISSTRMITTRISTVVDIVKV
jgi:hypothetical protein